MKFLRSWLSAYHGWWVAIVEKRAGLWMIVLGIILLGGMVMFENLHLPLWIAVGVFAALTPGFFAAMSVVSSRMEDPKKRPPRTKRKK